MPGILRHKPGKALFCSHMGKWLFSLIGASLLILGLTSCNEGDKGNQTAPLKNEAKQFFGVWESEMLSVEIESYGGIEDSTLALEADRVGFAETFGILPILTVFREDYTYYSEYRSLDSTVQQRGSGFFEVKGDTMVMHVLEPRAETLRLSWVRKDDSTYGFIYLADQDRDGAKDDKISTLIRRIAL